MAYRFDGTDDRVEFDIAPINGYAVGAFTMAAFFKRTTLATNDFPIYVGTSAFADKWVLWLFTNNTPRVFKAETSTSSLAINDASKWYLLVATASGLGAAARFHLWDGTSWSHAAGSTALSSAYTVAGTDRLTVGGKTGSAMFVGDMVCAGIKKADSSDVAVETLSPTSFQPWRDFGFDWLIGFDSSLESGGILQDQGAAGTGDEIGIIGTTAVADPAGWTWAGAATLTRAAALAAAAAITTAGTVVAGAATLTGAAAVAATGAVSASGTIVDVVLPPGPAPEGRFLVAFDDDTLAPYPTWTRIDAYPSLLTSYTIDRGRSYELDRTDVGRATVQISDTDGILDPTNPDGPFFGQIEPLLQATIGRWNPVAEEWVTRFRGFIEEMDYSFDPSQQVNRLTVTLIDVFEILNAVKMWPGEFGEPSPPDESADQVFFDNAHMDDRIRQVFGNTGIPPEFYVVFSGNVWLQETVYSPGQTAMEAIQEAADADFPGVSNVYTDRFGRLAVHGRHAKFDPVGVASGATEGAWDWHQWHCGDRAAVTASPATTAQIRRFSANRGLAKVINWASAVPKPPPSGWTADEIKGQLVTDAASIARFGIRPWEAQDLLTQSGLASGNTALEETRLFAEYYVANYSLPRNRITELALRSIRPGSPGSSETWRLMSLVDVSDRIYVTVASPGGGGLDNEPYFVEGVHEECRPLNPEYDDVTVRLDLSPQAYFTVDPWTEP